MYQFNLESLLNHRRYRVEVLQKELADLKIYLDAQKDKLWVLRQKKRNTVLQLQKKQTDVRPSAEIKLYIDFVEQLSKEMEAQRHKVLEAERNFSLKRLDLVAALKKRKILDRLKEKGLHAYEQEQLKKERSFMDEVAGHQFNQKP
ncbi:MAG: flagellar export protein FliJ [Desulfobacterales bacterium]|nr:flagellar export protein FliJ [Desulfobacterales bacterium]